MKKIQNLEELKNLKKDDLINEMLQGTIKGGSSCGTVTFNKKGAPVDIGPIIGGPGTGPLLEV